MRRFWRRKRTEPAPPRRSVFTTDALHEAGARKALPTAIQWEQPHLAGVGLDSSLDGTVPAIKHGGYDFGIPESQAAWYVSQSFIGYSMCAAIAKHWLVDKAISMPARDAVRQGYRIECDHADVIKTLEADAKDRDINAVMRALIWTGRAFGGAAALTVVESTDPDYYEKPFNPDGILPGMYKGIRILEPNWMTPDLTASNMQDPASLDFYNPSFWIIGGRRYHRSHFNFYVPYPVADLAKHTYRYFGVSVPERIYERVYAAERTANEAPQLAMTKRLLTMGIPGLADADKQVVAENVAYFIEMRDNYGIQVADDETKFNQYDTALNDLDATIMTQYQLVAAASNVPAAKLMETTPKGFNATGEFEESSYHEGLESIQTHDLNPLLLRHFDAATRNLSLGDHEITVIWNPLDSPTAKEQAEINNLKSQTAKNYADLGAVDGTDVRDQLKQDPESGYFGLGSQELDFDITEYLTDETDEEARSVGEEPEEREAGW